MCQATVYLDGHEVMRDVLRLERTPEGIRLYAFFEEPRVIDAAIDEIDLIKHRIMLVAGDEGRPNE
jgi:predicted RNA-binding protein